MSASARSSAAAFLTLFISCTSFGHKYAVCKVSSVFSVPICLPSRNAVIVTVQSALPNSGASSSVSVEIALAGSKLKSVGNQRIVLVAANFDLVCVILAVVDKLGFHTGFSDQSI